MRESERKSYKGREEGREKKKRKDFGLTTSTTCIFQISSFVFTVCTL